MKFTFEKVDFPLKAPFAITGYVFNSTETIHVTLTDGEHRGRGEAAGLFYLGETTDTICEQLEKVAPKIEAGCTRESLLDLLPYGGARNAIDCALWDVEAKKSGKTIWELVDMAPRPLKTVYTISITDADDMARRAAAASDCTDLKIKLDGDDPVGKMSAIRKARPDAALVIDVNQGWSLDELKEYAPAMQSLNVEMIEQPLKRGADAELAGYRSPVPLCADESCIDTADFAVVHEYYDLINIKLDKTGGLTEALALASAAKAAGRDLMVGNMSGSSLSMAPSYVIGQLCRFVDLDGPLLIKTDVANGLSYADGGMVSIPEQALWG